jgi:hypothetical protein
MKGQNSVGKIWTSRLVVIGCLIQPKVIYCDYAGLQGAGDGFDNGSAFVFVVAGFVLRGIQRGQDFCLLVFAGLACGFAGDVLLRLRILSAQHGLILALGTGAFCSATVLTHGASRQGARTVMGRRCRQAAVCAPLAYFFRSALPPPRLKASGGAMSPPSYSVRAAGFYLRRIRNAGRGAVCDGGDVFYAE